MGGVVDDVVTFLLHPAESLVNTSLLRFYFAQCNYKIMIIQGCLGLVCIPPGRLSPLH